MAAAAPAAGPGAPLSPDELLPKGDAEKPEEELEEEDDEELDETLSERLASGLRLELLLISPSSWLKKCTGFPGQPSALATGWGLWRTEQELISSAYFGC
ncbi:hypothetical protein Cadr_000024272 [Camelus dromedarius]|uniref:Uncharacterized protein n=1 Tax=Camelus dromedarius TaxID=9838 RepID=A0A5N4CQW0_CAMDR|nr:hypothetical protein Cadr_000024272 [Camelus dromedarius]